VVVAMEVIAVLLDSQQLAEVVLKVLMAVVF
jgi:hypothetical protein